MRFFLRPDEARLAGSSRFLEAKAFACYKGLFFFYFLAWCVIWPLAYDYMYLFLTWWAWYIGTFYFCISFITACMHIKRRRAILSQLTPSDGVQEESPMRTPSWMALTSGNGTNAMAPLALPTHMPIFERALLVSQLFTWNVSCVGSLIVGTVFWATLYDRESVSTVDINAHTFFALIMMVDQVLVASRCRLRDSWKAASIGILYLVFNIAWYFLGPSEDRVIYPTLDWGRYPLEAVAYSALILFVLTPAFGGLHCCIYRLRESIYASCRKRAAEDLPQVLQDHLLGEDRGSGTTRPNSTGSQEAQTGADSANL